MCVCVCVYIHQLAFLLSQTYHMKDKQNIMAFKYKIFNSNIRHKSTTPT